MKSYSALLALIMVLLSSCGTYVPIRITQIPPITSPSVFNTEIITPKNASQISDLKNLSAVFDKSPISAVAFNKENTNVLVAQYSGLVSTYDFKSGKEISSFTISDMIARYSGGLRPYVLRSGITPTSSITSNLSVNATEFDEVGTALVSASGQNRAARSSSLSSDLGGTSVWAMQTGDFIAPNLALYPENDVAISANGQWILTVSGSSAQLTDLHARQKQSAISFDYNEGSYPSFDTATLDSEGEFAALGSINGTILIARRVGDELNFFKIIEAGTPELPDYKGWNPQDVKFSPTRKWLAFIASGQLTVFDLQRNRKRFTINIGSANASVSILAFHPFEDVLAVGTDSGIRIFDLVSEMNVWERPNIAAFALRFSTDGHLFAYGDDKGLTHILGVKQ